MRLGTVALALWLAACGGEDPPATEVPEATGDTAVPGVALTDLAWTLHAEFGSVVRVTWEQDQEAPVHIGYSFDDGVWQSSPVAEGVVGRNERTVVGIPYGERAAWRLVSGEASVEGPQIVTEGLPAGLPVGTVEIAQTDAWDPADRYLLTSINQVEGGWVQGIYWTMILDRQARVVWAHKTPDWHWTLFPQVSASGDHILWDEATAWQEFDRGAGSTVHRTWLDGAIEVIPTPGLHHPFTELPDGTIAWGALVPGGEAIHERAPGAKDVTQVWRCGRGCQSNCLYYDPDRDTYLFSTWSHNTVVEVDRSTGAPAWYAGDLPYGYVFDPPASQFWWQHGTTWTDADTLLLSSRRWVKGERRTFVIEYAVDETAGTLTLVWSYDSGVHAQTVGDARRLDNGNTLHVIGSAGHVKEVAPSTDVVWHVDFHSERLLGRGEFIEDLYALVQPRPTAR